MNAKLKFIFFDVGNTLLFPNRERIHAPLTRQGVEPEAEHLRDLECRTKNKFDGMMTTSGSTDHSFWWMFYTQLLSEIRVTDDAIRDQLVSGIRNSPTGTQSAPAPPSVCMRSASATGSPSSPMRMAGSKTCCTDVASLAVSTPSPTPGKSATKNRTRKFFVKP